jgi:hypothetical protein
MAEVIESAVPYVAIGVVVAVFVLWALRRVIVTLIFGTDSWAIRHCDAVPEPDAITRLAAVADPKSEAAEHVRKYENWIAYRNETMNRVFGASSELAKKISKLK